MALALLLALQTAAAPPPPMARVDFDLAKLEPSEADPLFCGQGKGDEIVVCGRVRRPEQRFWPDELPEWPDDDSYKLGRAAVHLGDGADAGLMFSPVEFPGGGMSNRMMVTFHFKF